MVPCDPRETVAVWAELRRRIEIVTRGHNQCIAFAVRINRDDGVDGFRTTCRVVLADREDELPHSVDDHVGVPDAAVWCDRPRGATGILPVEPLVVVIGEPHRAVLDREVATSVLVHTRAGVEGPRSDIRKTAVRFAPADDDPSA